MSAAGGPGPTKQTDIVPDLTVSASNSSSDKKEVSAWDDFVSCFTGRSNKPQKPPLEQQLAVQYNQLNKELKAQIAKINEIHEFVKARSDLNELTTDYTKKYSHYIVQHSIPAAAARLNPNDLIDRITALKMQIAGCKSLLEESMQFVMRHDEIRECYMKHQQAAAKLVSAVPAKQVTGNTATVEEIS